MSKMYSRVPWLKPVDTAIIQLLSSPKPLRLTPANIALNIDYERGYVAARCRELEEKEFLKRSDKEGEPNYQTTELGEKFSRGEIPVEDLLEMGEDQADDED